MIFMIIMLSVYALPKLFKNIIDVPPENPVESDTEEIDEGAIGGGPGDCVHYYPEVISEDLNNNNLILYLINEEISSNLRSPEESTGGVEYLSYTYPLDLNFLFIESRLIDYVGEDKFREWTHAEYANGTYLYVNVLTFIQYFNLTKEQFTEACDIYPEFPLYDEEGIEILFSGDIEKILRYTKAAGAVYSNGKLFSAEWLDTHTIVDYITAGIDFYELENAKEATLTAIRNFSKNPEIQYQEKIAEYKIRLKIDENAHNDFNVWFDANYHSIDLLFIRYIYPESFDKWIEEAGRLSAEYATEQCKHRYFTMDFFIKYFNIKREDFEKLYYNTYLYSVYEYNLDVLYSGDKDLVEQYYSKISVERIREMEARAELRYAKDALVKKTFGVIMLNGESMSKEYEAWIRSLDKDNIIGWLDENIPQEQGWFLAANSLWSIDEFIDYWGDLTFINESEEDLAPPPPFDFGPEVPLPEPIN